MAMEIERKFIVPLAAQHLFLNMQGGIRQVQAYLSDDPARTVRLRLIETDHGRTAKMTVKGRPRHGGVAKPEWEWDMPIDVVTDMIQELNPPYLDKVRHEVVYADGLWEVDVLKVKTVGPPSMWRYLVTAEVEMPSLEAVRSVPLPPWVAAEVTGNKTYAMSMLTTETARQKAWREAYKT